VGQAFPKIWGLGQGKCLSSGPHILECSSLAHKLTHSKARKAQAESNAFQGFFLCIWKSFVLYTRKACYHRPPLIFGPKTEGYKHQIGAGPPRTGVSLPLCGNQFKVFFPLYLKAPSPHGQFIHQLKDPVTNHMQTFHHSHRKPFVRDAEESHIHGCPIIFKPMPTGYRTQGYTNLKLGESNGSCNPSPIYYHEPKHW
jgi:hypothetical protein